MTRCVKHCPSTSRLTVRPYRRWSVAQKRKIVAETYEAGQSVSIVARRHDMNANQLFRWRRQFNPAVVGKALVAVDFIPVGVVERKEAPPSPATNQAPGMMTIILREGISIQVDRDVDDRALRRVLMTVARMT